MLFSSPTCAHLSTSLSAAHAQCAHCSHVVPLRNCRGGQDMNVSAFGLDSNAGDYFVQFNKTKDDKVVPAI
jgi:hypothetical protein